MQRHPNLKFILCHGGGFIPFAVQRFTMVLEMMNPSRTAADYAADYRSFYLDSALATAPATMRNVLDFADPSHLLFGSDFPFCRPDEIAMFVEQFDAYEMDPELRSAIKHRNAEALFPRFTLDAAARSSSRSR